MLKHEGPSKHPKAGHHRPTSETPFEWRFAGGPMVARHFVLAGVLYLQNFYTFSIHITVAIDTVAKQFLISVLFLQKSHLMMASFLKFVYLSVGLRRQTTGFITQRTLKIEDLTGLLMFY